MAYVLPCPRHFADGRCPQRTCSRPAGLGGRARPRLLASAAPAPLVLEPEQAVLEWATQQRAYDLPCRAGPSPETGVRGLIATQDIRPGETILAVPLDRVYQSQAENEGEMHWSAEMALRLLKDQHACATGAASPQQGWCPWLASLPKRVITPLESDDTALEAVADPLVRGEVQAMQDCISACYEEVEAELTALGYTWSDYINAVELLHSRCFFTEGRHLAVPGVDLCNHSFTPTARVEVRHSPSAVQGLAALEEVADPATLPQEPSRFCLVANEEGVRQGQEITISYGSHADTVFFLLFGFLPKDNPHNSVIIFPDIHDLALALVQHSLSDLQHPHTTRTTNPQASPDEPMWPAVLASLDLHKAIQDIHTQATSGDAQQEDSDSTQQQQQQPPFQNLSRLVVTAGGWDYRFDAALRVAGTVVARACQDALAGASTDTGVSPSSSSGSDSGHPTHTAALQHILSRVATVAGLDGVGGASHGAQQRAKDTWAAANAALGLRDVIRGVVACGCRERLRELTRAQRAAAEAQQGTADGEDVCLQLARTFTERQIGTLRTALARLSPGEIV